MPVTRRHKSTAILLLGTAAFVSGAAQAQDVTLGPGDDRYQVDTTSTVKVDGGRGEDTLVLYSPSTRSIFAGELINFERMQVFGDWSYGGKGAFPLGIEINQTGRLYTTAESIGNGPIINHGTFSLSAFDDSVYSGNLTGEGYFIKDGPGRLTYTGTSPNVFGGQLYVAAGTLDLANQFRAPSYYIRPAALLTSGRSGTIDGSLFNGVNITVDESGMIDNYASGGRAIDLVLDPASSSRTHDIVNSGTIRGAGEAIRLQYQRFTWRTSILNSGLIEGVGGSAINLVTQAGGYQPTITNSSSGTIRSNGAAAINLGGGILKNSGLIEGLGSAADGVNYAQVQGNTGAIIGGRNGVVASAVVNGGGGTILGRNGAGIIGSYGNFTSGPVTVTNGGYIAGGWDGASATANGDGINLAGISGTITINNFGTIAGLGAHGTDANGANHTSDGIEAPGGTINNNGFIDGADYGIRGAGTINNYGSITGGTAAIGAFAPSSGFTIHNYGSIVGRNGLALQLGGGADAFYYYPGSTVGGTIDGGGGIDEIYLMGDASTVGTFGNAVPNVEWIRVVNGTWTLTNLASYSTGTRINVYNGQTAILEVPVDTNFSGWLVGTSGATAIKRGAGTLFIDLGLWSGTLTIQEGAVTPIQGSQFPTSGDGAIGSAFIAGDFDQGAGTSYIADVGSAGADAIMVGGRASIGDGARLVVNRDGDAHVGDRHVVLAAAGGIAGAYTLEQVANPDSEFRIVRNGNVVAVELARTAGNLVSLPTTANERAVAPAVAALGPHNAAYAALTLEADDAAARNGLSALAGETHATIRTVVLRDTRALTDGVRDQAGSGQAIRGIWLRSTGTAGTVGGAGGLTDLRSNGWGLVGGADTRVGDTTRVGMAFGYSRSQFDLSGRASGGDVRSSHVLAYLRTERDRYSLIAGVGYARLENDVRRTIVLPGLGERLSSQYGGDLVHGFAEISTRMGDAEKSIEPFAGLAAYRIRNDAFTESGGSSALSGDARSNSFAIGSVGVRAVAPILPRLSVRSQVEWQHTLGGSAPQASLMFGSGQRFAVTGTELPRDAAALSLDLTWRPAAATALSVGYRGTVGDSNADNSVRAQLSMRF